MPLICYTDRSFSQSSQSLISHAVRIIGELKSQGYNLTLRQLYYQFVSKGLIPNRQTEYKRLGSVLNDARLAGLIDWEDITDRTRDYESNSHWNSPADIIEAVAQQFQFDKWKDQPQRPEVWVEKDALEGIVASACKPLDVGYFSCRGYASQTAIWEAAMRLRTYVQNGQTPVIFHFGDHDPSGIDMTRDIRDRLSLFMTHHDVEAVEVQRLALTMTQVKQYNPPPNPAKLTDSRADEYIATHGNSSWELDALDPRVITGLIQKAVYGVRNEDLWAGAVHRENKAKASLQQVSQNWNSVVQYVEGMEDS